MLWLYTLFVNLQLQSIARERDERKDASNDFISLISQFLFIDESSNWWKSNLDTLRIDIETVVPETPLAVIVMDTYDWRPPKRSFWNGKKTLEGVCDW